MALSVILDRAGAFGYTGSDQRRFHRQAVVVTRVMDGEAIVVKPADSSQGTTETKVHLLGIDAPELPDAHWATKSAKYTAARALGRTVTLRLDPIGWQNDRGEICAYVFITDSDNLNLALIRDGQAYADRRTPHSLHASFASTETEARKKQRGLWKDLTHDQMPQWRQEWLRSRGF